MHLKLPCQSLLLCSVMLVASCSSNQSTKGNTSKLSTLPQNNTYQAPYAKAAPLIDGKVDSIWHAAPWQAIDVLWLFKVLWDETQLYLLLDITDDVLFDHDPNPLKQYWIDDTVELFIDPDHSGGDHRDKNFDNAWAYHISTVYDVVDSGPTSTKLYNEHITVKKVSHGSQHLWEMSIRIYDKGYNDKNFAANSPAVLHANKILGFSASYIDNDNSLPTSKSERESMMGSVDTQGHKDNLGYINADVLGDLILVK